MRKILSILLLSFFLADALFAFDYQGGIASYTTGASNDIKKIQISEKLEGSYSFTQPFDFYGNTILNMGGFLSVRWFLNTTIFDTVADLTDLSLAMSIPLGDSSSGTFEMGRQETEDYTGYIFNQKADGIRFSFSGPKITVNAFAAYTGLLNSRNNLMFPRYAGDTSGIYPLAQPYLTTAVNLYVKELLEDKSFGLEVIEAMNMSDFSANSLYGTARIDGEFLYFIPYTLCTSFQLKTGGPDSGRLANLSYATMEYTINTTHFGGKILHASGNIGGMFTDFRSISAVYADKTDVFPFTNLITVGIFGDYKHNNNVTFIGSSDLFMSLEGTPAKLSVSGINFKLDVDIPLFKGSKLSFDFGQYFPFFKGNYTSNLELCIKYGF